MNSNASRTRSRQCQSLRLAMHKCPLIHTRNLGCFIWQINADALVLSSLSAGLERSPRIRKKKGRKKQRTHSTGENTTRNSTVPTPLSGKQQRPVERFLDAPNSVQQGEHKSSWPIHLFNQQSYPVSRYRLWTSSSEEDPIG